MPFDEALLEEVETGGFDESLLEPEVSLEGPSMQPVLSPAELPVGRPAESPEAVQSEYELERTRLASGRPPPLAQDEVSRIVEEEMGKALVKLPPNLMEAGVGPVLRAIFPEVSRSMAERLSESAAVTPGLVLTAPAYTIPFVGPAALGVQGAAAVGAGLGEASVGVETGQPELVGGGLGTTTLGASMVVPTALHALKTARAVIPSKAATTTTPQPVGGPSAVQVRETTPVLRDVPEQPRVSAGEVPAAEGAVGVPRGVETPQGAGGTEVPLKPPPVSAEPAVSPEGEIAASARVKRPERGLPESATESDLMADMTQAGRTAFKEAKAKPDEFSGVDVTDLSSADRRNLARLGLSFAEDRARRIIAIYPRRLRTEDIRKRVAEKVREPAVSPAAETVKPAAAPTALRLSPAEKAALQVELEAEQPGLSGETPTDVGPALGASKPSEHVPLRATATNITKERIEAYRQARGLASLFSALREKNPVVYDRAMARIDQNPAWQDELVRSLQEKPRTPEPEEIIALDHRYIDLQNEYAKATRDMALAYDDGRLSDLPYLRDNINIWQDKLDAFEKMARASMSEWGRSGQISQQLMREDYSLVPMIARKRAAVGGRPLTDAEILSVQKQSDALSAAATKADEALVTAKTRVSAQSDLIKQRDDLQMELKSVGEEPTPKLQHERVVLREKKAAIVEKIKAITQRIQSREFGGKRKQPLDLSMDENLARLQAQYEHLKDSFKEELRRDEIRSAPFLKKATIEGKEMLNISRNLKSSMDVSAVLRQGAFVGFGHPVMAARTIPKMFRALANVEAARALNQSIRLRPNAINGKYAKGDVFFGKLESPEALSAQEELLMSRWAGRVPGLRASNRAYVTYLNLLRADAFDAMVRAWETKGPLTDVELKAAGNYINVATGRGNLGRFSAAAEPLSLLFFSPRLATSRFQILAAQPMWEGTARSRVGIAKEYARFAAGIGAFYALAKFAGYDVGGDPKAADFGKIRVGNTMLDPLAGLSQVAVFETRLATGETKDLAHRATSILSDAPYGKPTVPDVIARFLRTKLAPVPSTALTARTGKDFLGRPVTVGTSLRDLYFPLSVEDIYREMTVGDNALPEDLALAVLIMFGMGAQTGDKPLPRP